MSSDRDEDQGGRTPYDRKLVVSLSISFVVVAAIVGAALYLHRSDDGCGSWEVQLGALTESLTRHRLAKGNGRIAAIDDLESLQLQCGKVAKTRDVCADAYRHLILAEKEQQRAKQTIGRIESLVAGLEEPQRTVAKRRILENASIEDVAHELGRSEEEVEGILGEAYTRLGSQRLEDLHGSFEKAVKASQRHVEQGAEKNDACDVAFKRLLEEAQVR